MFDEDLTPRPSLSGSTFDILGSQNFHIETSALHRKLQSKCDALRILRQELEKFRTERDQFKLMAETLQLRYSAIRRTGGGEYGCSMDKSSMAALMHETRERNIKLTTEVESLKQKLVELQGDIEVLRGRDYAKPQTTQVAANNDEIKWKQERSNFIHYLENLKRKNAQLAFDLKALIDEKEELVTERDAYKCKAHRLNHELFAALQANEAHPKFLDIDSILLENKYLQESTANLEEDLELTKQSMQKYKTMLEAKRKKGIIKLGGSSTEENILSHKQVQSLLESGVDLPTKAETIQDLKSLCLAVLDNLNDKNLALNHQKKTNKILATKIAELEQRIQTLIHVDSATSESIYSPSQLLLHGYCASSVDANSVIEEESVVPTAVAAEEIQVEITCAEETPAMSTDPDDSQVLSDDAMSSISSGRSILSSEYGIDPTNCGNPSQEISKMPLFTYQTSSTTTADTGSYGLKVGTKSLVPSSITRERMNDLKDLPPELAAMVQHALHELDMRDFDDVIAGDDACDEDALSSSFDEFFKIDETEKGKIA